MRSPSYAQVIINVINFVIGVILLGLGIRFLFRLFGANPESGIVEFIYNSTASLLEPFKNIFTTQEIEPGKFFEFSALIAMAMYMLLGWLLVELVMFLVYNANQTYRRTTVTTTR